MPLKSYDLKAQDILVLLKIHVTVGPWTTRSLAAQLFMSSSEISTGLRRAENARLLDLGKKRPMRRALAEFLVHGVKYAFPPQRDGLTRGMPTCYAAPPMNEFIVQPNEYPPVWPDPNGTIRGYSFFPLYKSVPQAAAADEKLYEMLVLVDTIRDGRARESEIAIRELRGRLAITGDQEV